jgi:hypothetical protein
MSGFFLWVVFSALLNIGDEELLLGWDGKRCGFVLLDVRCTITTEYQADTIN